MSTKKSLLYAGLAVVFVVGAIMACCPTPEAQAVTIIINSPGSGAKVAVGEEVSIDSTATADAGVDRVELTVSGTLVSRDVPPSGNPTTFRVVQLWTPTAEGLATISVVAFDENGASSDSATITLQVGESNRDVSTDGPGTVVPPEATETPLPPVTTDAGCTPDSQHVADVTIPDGTVMSPGQAFVKTWRVRNSGTCDWGTGYELVFVSGAQMGGPASVPLPAVSAGGEAEVSVSQTAPSAYGTHKGTWRMRADDGTMFGVNLSALITVPAPVTNTPEPPPPTVTPEPAPPTNLQASVQEDGSVRFTWNDAVGEAGYQYNLEFAPQNGPPISEVHPLAADTTSWTSNRLGCGGEGDFYLWAYAGDSSEIGEVSVHFETPACPSPDLTVSDLTVTPDNGYVPFPVSVEVRVRNVGDGPSGDFHVQWIGGGGACTWPVSSLDPGEEHTLECTAAIAGAGSVGTIALADVGNEVDEINEDNNTRVFPVTGRARP